MKQQMTGNGQTDRQTDELMPAAIYTHSHIILYTNWDVSSPHWLCNKTVPDTWFYQLLWLREGQNIVFSKWRQHRALFGTK